MAGSVGAWGVHVIFLQLLFSIIHGSLHVSPQLEHDVLIGPYTTEGDAMLELMEIISCHLVLVYESTEQPSNIRLLMSVSRMFGYFKNQAAAPLYEDILQK